MKKIKIFPIIVVLVFVGVVGFIAYNVIADSRRKFYATILPVRQTITNKFYIPGNVYPVKEVDIKSQLSGVLERLNVKTGDHVVAGTAIASIQLVPNSSDIEQLENNVKITKIDYDAQTIDYERNKGLYAKKTIPKVDMETSEKAYLLSKEKYNSALNQLNILKRGYR